MCALMWSGWSAHSRQRSVLKGDPEGRSQKLVPLCNRGHCPEERATGGAADEACRGRLINNGERWLRESCRGIVAERERRAGPKDMKTPAFAAFDLPSVVHIPAPQAAPITGGLQTKTCRCTGPGRGEQGKNLLEEGPGFLQGRDRALLGWKFDAAVLVKQASKEKAGNDDAQRITSTSDGPASIQCAHMSIHSGAMIQF
ncbi:hypothetical protein FQA47_015058 [Oryzias melastigma]|uniref:Uncharacterized protein n=1 Tax=Oryzias melastigma TaxID=30732 RepID=A0A834C859_ORYME|nr:hypothetical protein FQA47_015058 [Oryzias melastigma]